MMKKVFKRNFYVMDVECCHDCREDTQIFRLTLVIVTSDKIEDLCD